MRDRKPKQRSDLTPLWLALFVIAILVWKAPARAESLWNKFTKDIHISGSKTLSWRQSWISGNQEVYHDETYWGNRSPFYDYTELNIEGKIFNYFSVQTRLTSNRYMNEQPRFLFAYEAKKTRVSMGDLYATLNGNILMPFSRNLRGVMVESQWGPVKFQTLFSETKARTKRVLIRGNNTPGPYFLQAYSIVDGSERVRVDDIDKTLGKDYTLNYYTGSIEFTQMIPETSTIVVEYETRDRADAPGMIWGSRLTMPVMKNKGMVGLTFLTQKANTHQNLSPIGEQQDRLAAYNNSPGPYQLTYASLIEFSEVVKVDGILYQRDVDYRIDYRLGTLFFLRPVLEDSHILVNYRYNRDATVTPDRSVMGLDTTLQLTKNLDASFQFAKSATDASGNPGGGSASNLRLTGRFGKLNMAMGVKSTSPKFASLETVGFSRNEKGTDLSFDYTPSSAVKLYGQFYNYKRAGGGYYSSFYSNSTTDSTQDFITAKQGVLGINLTFPKWPQISFTRTRMTNGGTVSSSLTTDSLGLKHSFGKLTLAADLLQSTNATSGRVSDSSGNDLYDPSRAKTTSKMTHLSVSYLPGNKLSLSGDISTGKITSGDSSTNSNNMQLTANMHDMFLKNLTIALNYRVSSAGGVVGSYYGGIGGAYPIDNGSLLGYNNIDGQPLGRQVGYNNGSGYYGGGSGYYGGGSGYYGGGSGYYGGGTGYYGGGLGSRSVSRSIAIQYSPFQKLALNLNLDRTVSDYDGGSNTDSTNQTFGLAYTLWRDATLTAQFSQQKSTFLRTAGGDLKNSIQFYALRFPLKKFTFSFQHQLMNSNNNYNPYTSLPGTDSGYPDGGLTGKDGTSSGYGSGYGGGLGYGFFGNRSNMKAFTARVEYPIAEGRRLFLEFQRSSLLGGYDITKATTAFGIEYQLSRILTLTVDLRNSQNSSSHDPRYNYRALSLNADISAKF